LLRQIVDRPLYFGNQYPAGDDDVMHELLETFAAPGGRLLSLGGGDLTLTTPHHPIHDVYRDGETYRQEYVAPPMPAGVALDFAEDHLAENTQRFTRRFEEWHEIRNR
jgi:hypothetical protein